MQKVQDIMLPSVQGVQGVCKECRECAGGAGSAGSAGASRAGGCPGGWGLSVEEQSFWKDEASKSKVWV